MATVPKLRILMTHWHESYTCLLAKTGHNFDVLPVKGWEHQFRPVPGNVRFVHETDVRACDLHYDLAVFTGLPDLVNFRHLLPKSLPKIFVMLNMLDTDLRDSGLTKAVYLDLMTPLLEAHNVRLAFISEKKRANWGVDAPVIPSGVSLRDYNGYDGYCAQILCVGNLLKERTHMMGLHLHANIVRDLPITYLGYNPSMSHVKPAESWNQLRSAYGAHRVFLSTLLEEHEDGYNLAVLEAMATGMPVVCLENSTSPIHDHNGYMSNNFEFLHEALRAFLMERNYARRCGNNARQTVGDNFPEHRCVGSWNALFLETANARH